MKYASSAPKALSLNSHSSIKPSEGAIISKYVKDSYQKVKQQQEQSKTHKKVTISIASIMQKSAQKEEKNVTALFNNIDKNIAQESKKSSIKKITKAKKENITLEGTLKPKK